MPNTQAVGVINGPPNAAFGYSVAINDPGTRIAIGAPLLDSLGGDTGHVQIFGFISGSWTNIRTINGDASDDLFGASISLNSSGSTVAIGASEFEGFTSVNSNYVKIYDVDTGNQIGQTIDTTLITDGDKLGLSVCLNAAGNRVAIGAPDSVVGSYTRAGKAAVFELITGTWTKMGSDIEGLVSDNMVGRSVYLNDAGDNLLVASDDISNNPAAMKKLTVWEYSGSAWIQKPPGGFFNEDPSGIGTGNIVMSGMGNRIATCAGNDIYGFIDKVIRVWDYSTGTWNSNDTGIPLDSSSGYGSFAITGDTTLRRIADRGNGTVKIFDYDSTTSTWHQIKTLNYYRSDKGPNIAMSSNGTRMVAGINPDSVTIYNIILFTSVITGTVPPTTEGVNYDYYLDTTTDILYGPKTGGVWGTSTTKMPIDVPNGAIVLSEVTPPGDLVGNDGDYCVDVFGNMIYGPKAGGVWPLGQAFLTSDAGNGSPTNGYGADGDYYVDTTTDMLWGPKGTPTPGQWTGPPVRLPIGIPNGAIVIAEAGAPTAGDGNDGDYYVDPTGEMVYGPKAGGVWPAGIPFETFILIGTVDPTTEGVNGDAYINTTDDTLFGPKAGGVWPPTSIQLGQDIPNGAIVLADTDPPTGSVGQDGDYLIDLVGEMSYGPKAGGVWPSGVPFVAPYNGSGTGPPSNGIGVDGDYYVDTTDDYLYGPKGTPTPGQWPTPGMRLPLDISDGSTVTYGSGAPNNANGSDGDYYIDPTGKIVYGPKAGGVWPAGIPFEKFVIVDTSDPTTEGADGDYYINSTNESLFGPKAGGVWPSPVYRIDQNIPDGAIVIESTSAPTSGTGRDGDYLIDNINKFSYGPKASGTWPSGIPFVKISLTGTIPPGSGIGNDDDYYVDTSTDEFYGPKAGGVWPSSPQQLGQDIPDGANIIVDTGAPTGSDGVDGDYYIDPVGEMSYGPKAGGVWPSGVPFASPPSGSGGTLRSGSGPPNNADGDDGDFYIDTTDHVLYGPKAGGVWPTPGFSLTGPPGNSILNGTTTPNNSLGNDGDFYIDTTTMTIYGPKAGGVWPAGIDLQGPSGSNGSTILSGTVDPTTQGNDGDFYINTATSTFFGPKAGGVWPAGIDLQGPSGSNGSTILSGTVDPTTQGNDGDFYINTATSTFFGPKAGGVWPAGINLQGPSGTPGTNGNTILSGTVNPTTQGNDGDFYLNTATSTFFGPKAGGVWPAGIDLQGPSGTPGTNGNTILSGTVNPTTQGNDGDFYLNTATNTFFGPKAGGVWPAGINLQGPSGTPGTNGNTILSGTVNPTTQGNDGDFYLNTATNTFFGPKAGGVWPAGINLQGPSGTPGTNGNTILSGTVNPTTQGNDGDFYLNTATNTFFGPKAGGVWPAGINLQGPSGTPGTNGNTILSGTVNPTTQGNDGDFYLNTATSTFFGPKAGGVWPAGIDLQGPSGTPGTNGNTILSGTVNPTTQGNDGDFYLNTATNTFFGPKAGGVWPAGINLQGPSGTPGTNGNTILSGTVNPTTQGNDGDFYLNTATNTFFGPKAGGVWPAGINLQGPSGTPGTNGNTILSGTVNPTTQGNDGDFYLNTATNTFFGPKAGGVWPAGINLQGPSGTPGNNGSTILSGTVNPTTQGNNGDYYLNTTTGTLLGPKAGGVWPTTGLTIVGANGLSILSGTANPTTQGVNGDLYINTMTGTLFGPKTGGAWPSTGLSLVGASGTKIFSGTTAPANTLGNNGDFYINTTTGTFIGPKAGGVWPPTGIAITGTPGIDGANGSTILSGIGAPANTLGKDGDIYIDRSTGNFYGPKDNNAWPNDFFTFPVRNRRNSVVVSSARNTSVNASGFFGIPWTNVLLLGLFVLVLVWLFR